MSRWSEKETGPSNQYFLRIRIKQRLREKFERVRPDAQAPKDLERCSVKCYVREGKYGSSECRFVVCKCIGEARWLRRASALQRL